MADADTPMTSQREVRERKRGLYWLVAASILLMVCFAIFGFADEFAEESGGLLGNEGIAVVSEDVEAGGVSGDCAFCLAMSPVEYPER